MVIQTLNGEWLFRERGADEWLPGRVPGGVHPDLIAAGRIPDPFIGDEELRVQWVAERDWEYRRDFAVDDDALAEERIELVFDGLDTLADIRLNGEWLGSADNMFRSWRFDLTGRVRAGANELSVTFRSAVGRAAELDSARHLDTVADQLPGAPHLRKAPSHFGWDWGPKLPNIGFWQGARLEAWSLRRIADVRLSQSIKRDHARVTAAITVERTGSTGPLVARLTVSDPGGRATSVAADLAAESICELSVDIADPELWWPNGLGGQPLYLVGIAIADQNMGTREGKEYRIGLRTIELRREPDDWGESFTFVVNGVPVFAKGSNWIPADSFPGRIEPTQVESLLAAAADANHNMVRVWGGGYYETEAFYDACDRLGLLVWQDFMFACSVYPLQDAAFLENVRAETTEQVRRLAHRACLALWCGNNEMERGWANWGWDRPETQDLKAAYLEFFGETLPGWVASLDGATPYWPSSPSSGRPLVEAIGGRAGDDHEWTVWHGLEPFAAYGRESYRFVSEFGFESVPAEATIAAFAPDRSEWNLGSPLLDHHQRCPSGNARILYYLAQQFRLPHEFTGFVYLSQVLQAEAMRVGVEHWRRERERCGGALYWQLNDCWPVSSWSSLDYFGRWKALHYATRRFFAPVLLSCSVESGATGPAGGATPGGDPAPGGQAVLTLTNDMPAPWRGDVRWSLERLDGRIVDSGTVAVEARGLGTTHVASVAAPVELEARRNTVLVAEAWARGVAIGRVVTLFVTDKHLALTGPAIDATVQASGKGDPRAAEVLLRSDVLARWVELAFDGVDIVTADNYFDLPAGRETTIGFVLPAGWDLARAKAALRIRSVADTYS
jgi:beta-mannosidase